MRLLFIHGGLFTFTKIDLEILSAAFDVEEVHVSRTSAVVFVRSVIASLLGILRSDIVFSWFGAYHALLPFALAKLLGKPTVVIASGYDVACQPEIDYGNMRPGLHRWVGKAVFRLAVRILAVSEFTAGELAANVGVSGRKVAVVVHGVPVSAFANAGYDRAKEPFVLTVAGVTHNNLIRKGLLTLVEAARLLPGVLFVVVGPFVDDSILTLRAAAPANVLFLGPKYGDELTEIMCRAKVYAQLSAYESFGMALAESMVCGAVPVTTGRAALAEVAGDCGETVPYGDPAATAAAIIRALESSADPGVRAREHILTTFTLERRRARLIEEVEALYALQLSRASSSAVTYRHTH